MIAGRYEQEREIARGGMGAVWLGRDALLGREVALKRIGLLPGGATPDLQRAEREARLAARLNHPHVVAVFDLVEDAGQNWLVMEYVQGVTLSALVNEDGALTPDEAAPLLCQAADALAAAHAAGIVHRDVKPSNMLVTRDGEIKVTDFGIARAEADASLTRTGLVTGSPAYLAPEVAAGASATEASDVWALGTSLFHALAGHPPYDVTENLMGALYRIVHEDPPRLSQAGWLAPALENTMARRPEDRWTMPQVRDFLAQGPGERIHPRLLDADAEDGTRVLQPTASEPVAVPPVPGDPQLVGSEPAGRSRRSGSPWPWAAAAVLLVVLVALGAAALLGRNHAPTAGTAGHHPSSPPPSSHPAHSSSPSVRTASAGSMDQFITNYLSTVTSDRHAAWAMLTPAYQEASGGFSGYQGFWRTIDSATVRSIHADPGSLRVSYDVDYLKAGGTSTSELITLQLVRHGSTYLIANQLRG